MKAGHGTVLAAAVFCAVMLDAGSRVAATGQPAQEGANAAPSPAYQDVYNGWKWWHVYCYRCHGVDAVGTTMAPSLIDTANRRSSSEFLKIVRSGNVDKGMPGWTKLLDDKQIGQVHLYVRARAEKLLPPGRPDEVGPGGGRWVPPQGWPGK